MHDFGLVVGELKNYPFDWNGGDKSRPENAEKKLDKRKIRNEVRRPITFQPKRQS